MSCSAAYAGPYSDSPTQYVIAPTGLCRCDEEPHRVLRAFRVMGDLSDTSVDVFNEEYCSIPQGVANY